MDDEELRRRLIHVELLCETILACVFKTERPDTAADRAAAFCHHRKLLRVMAAEQATCGDADPDD